MKTTRRKFTCKFKAQVAIEAIKEREGMTVSASSLRDAVGCYVKPNIINSDQGPQYTCEHRVSTWKEFEIQTL
ncbi:MAG: hypothetical protein EBS53_13175 [Bacteroidetes bacterium]|nr:hypothetical protein [Bacteroidota bacterium]